jgi:hypothetical protein
MPSYTTPYVRRAYDTAPTMRIADFIRQAGTDAAEAQRRGGEISGQMWGTLGQQIGSTATGILQERQDAPRRAMQDDASRIGLENARAEQATARRATEDRSILASAQSSRLSPEEVKAQLQQLGRGDLVPLFDQTWMQLESNRLGLQKAKTEMGALEADYFGNFAAAIKKANFEPMAVEWALTEAAADGHDVTALRQQLQQTPDLLPQIVDQLIERSPSQRKLLGEEADRDLRTKQEARAIKTAEQTAADRADDNRRAAAQAAEVARHNRATEATAAAAPGRAGYFTMTPVYDQQGRPVGAMKLNARTGQTEFVQPADLGGVTARPPGNLGQRTVDNEAALDALDRLKRQFDTGAKTDIGPAEGRARRTAQAVPGGVTIMEWLGQDTKRFADFDAGTRAFQNAMIKAITGAQMSEPEAKRIMGQIPAITDHPTVWDAKYAQSVENLKDLERRTRTDRDVTAPQRGSTTRIGRFEVEVAD